MVRTGVVKPTIPRKWLGTKQFARVESERARGDHRNRIRVIEAEGVRGRENRLKPHVSSTARPANRCTVGLDAVFREWRWSDVD
jgi:hypothetical protein